jgi:hypothetical protein
MSFHEAIPPEEPVRTSRNIEWAKRAPEEEIKIRFDWISYDNQFNNLKGADIDKSPVSRTRKIGGVALNYLLKGLQGLSHLR